MGLRFEALGWTVIHANRCVTIVKVDAPADRGGAGEFDGYTRSFDPFGMNEEQIWRRVFATIQFLEDHERRENFEVNGVRVLDPHDPDITGLQQEWFIERESAVRGF